MGKVKQAFIQLLDQLTPLEGYNQTVIPGVTLYRAESPVQQVVSLYDPCLVFVAQRQKTGYIGGERFVYDPGHYLVVPTTLALECQVHASADEPFLAFSIPLEFKVVAELIAQMEYPEDALPMNRLAIDTGEMTPTLEDASLRLLKSLLSGDDAQVLGAQLIREIIFRVLQGPKARLLFEVFSAESKQFRIARALRFIQENFQKKLDVESLAKKEHMSVSSFHTHFKAVTSSSPLQYIKSIRLNRARDLIALQGLTNSLAANRVGYESVSQFSREFKTYFGYTPKSARLYYPMPHSEAGG